MKTIIKSQFISEREKKWPPCSFHKKIFIYLHLVIEAGVHKRKKTWGSY